MSALDLVMPFLRCIIRYLVAFVRRQVDSRAAPGVAPKRCIVLQPIAGAVLVHRQPTAVSCRIA